MFLTNPCPPEAPGPKQSQGHLTREVSESLRDSGESPRALGDSPRSLGDTLRALGESPRALGESPRARGDSPTVFVSGGLVTFFGPGAFGWHGFVHNKMDAAIFEHDARVQDLDFCNIFVSCDYRGVVKDRRGVATEHGFSTTSLNT